MMKKTSDFRDRCAKGEAPAPGIYDLSLQKV